MAQMTKAQLVDENIRLRAHIDAVERQRDDALDALHRLRDEVLAAKLQPASPFKIVTIRGERFAKVPSVVHGRTIITYKPLGAVAG